MMLEELEEAMHMLKKRKSPRESGIRQELLKWGGQVLIKRLQKVFNNCRLIHTASPMDKRGSYEHLQVYDTNLRNRYFDFIYNIL